MGPVAARLKTSRDGPGISRRDGTSSEYRGRACDVSTGSPSLRLLSRGAEPGSGLIQAVEAKALPSGVAGKIGATTLVY